MPNGTGLTKALRFVSRDRSNLAYESQHLLHHLQINKFQRWVSLAEGAHNQLGWLTTHGRKEVRCMQMIQSTCAAAGMLLTCFLNGAERIFRLEQRFQTKMSF